MIDDNQTLPMNGQQALDGYAKGHPVAHGPRGTLIDTEIFAVTGLHNMLHSAEFLAHLLRLREAP
jgi:hypothetical protein